QWTRCSWSPPSLALFLSISGVRPDVQLPFVEHGVDTSDVATHSLESTVVLQLAVGRLQPQFEQLGLGRLDLFGRTHLLVTVKCFDGKVLRTDCHSHSPPSLATIRALSGSLWIARRRASRATSSDTPASSNMTRPGLTLAIHHSGEPLPEPMRVSAGFFVSGWSG